MSHIPTKKSVFERIGGGGGSSTSPSGTTNISNKSTHGFCNSFVKSGTCPLGDTCKYIHEQPNLDKQQGPKDELRITKTITRVVDMSSSPIKSTVTVSNEQRPVIVSNSIQSTRTVVESVTGSIDHLDRRLSSSSDRKQSQSHNTDSKTKSSSSSIDTSKTATKKKSQSSSYEIRHSSNKKTRSMDSDSAVSSASDSEYTHSSHKRKNKSDHSTSSSSKHKKHDLILPNHDEEETLNDQLIRQTQSYTRSPKRTIVISHPTERKKDENMKRTNKEESKSRTKSMPDIEFLGSKKINRDKKSNETIHQQAESNKKSLEVKREKKSPSKSLSSDQQQRHHSSSTNNSSTSINEKNIQIKTEETKHQSSKTQNSSERYERSDRSATQSTPPVVVQLSPTSPIIATSEKESILLSNEIEKSTPVQPSSPFCVILDDDSSPAPSVDKKVTRRTPTTPVKKTTESDKSSSRQTKRSRDSDKSYNKEKSSENNETKRKRLNEGSSRKTTSSSKNGNANRSTSNRSDIRRSGGNTSSRDESSSRKYKENCESKTNRGNNSKDRNSTTSSSKSRNNNDRRDTTKSSPEKRGSIHRRGKEKGLENVTDSEEHLDEPVLPKQTAIEAYMSMDWSLLSRDKRIPLNTQVTSRITRMNNSNNLLSISERLLTNEQKEKLNNLEFQSSPLTHFMKQLQIKSTSSIINSCNRRFGSCAKDIIDMRHKWFTRSIEPVQQYEFINKEHYLAYQQAINTLLDKTSNDSSTVQIETTTADVLLS